MKLLRRIWAYARVLPQARRNIGDYPRHLVRRPAIAAAIGAYEAAVLFSNRLDVRLKYLAVLRVSSRVGCPL